MFYVYLTDLNILLCIGMDCRFDQTFQARHKFFTPVRRPNLKYGTTIYRCYDVTPEKEDRNTDKLLKRKGKTGKEISLYKTTTTLNNTALLFYRTIIA